MSIERLRSTISRRGGVLQPNRYAVYMPVPIMGEISLRNIVSGAFRTRSLGGTIQSLFNDPRDLTFLCRNATLPGRQIATTDWSTNPKMKKMPYAKITDDVSLTFIMTQDMFAKQFFDGWMNNIINEDHTLNYKNDYATDIIVQQLDKDNMPVYTVKFKNAFPVTVSEVELSADSADTVSTCTVTLSYDDWEALDLFEAIPAVMDIALPGAPGTKLSNKIKSLLD